MTETEDYDKSAIPAAHKTTHQDGGSDEVSVTSLSGELADDQKSTWAKVSGKPTTFTPEAHKTSHQDGGTDEISVAGLSGLLGDPQTPLAHKTSHQDAGADEISVAGLSGVLADDQHVIDTEVEAIVVTRQKARSYRGTAQQIPDNAWTKIEIDTNSFDPSGITDRTNYRIKPTTAGYYVVAGSVYILCSGGTLDALVAFRKSGDTYTRGQRLAAAGGAIGLSTSDIMWFDGATDFVELWILQASGAARNLEVGPTQNYLTVIGPL